MLTPSNIYPNLKDDAPDQISFPLEDPDEDVIEFLTKEEQGLGLDDVFVSVLLAYTNTNTLIQLVDLIIF